MAKPKVLFIVPPFSEHGHDKGKVEEITKKKEIRVYPTLGVCYLISGAEDREQHKYDIELIDAPAENLNVREVIQQAIERKPDIIAISIVTFTLYVANQIINACRKALPNAKIIIGGVHLNHSPQDFKYFDADYALLGDCEFTIRQLIECILNKKNAKDIQGIVYKENGQVKITKPAIIEDLDSIKFPDRTRLDPKKYIFPLFNKKFTTMIGSRGCPYKCIYCGLPYNQKYKKRSIANIIQEMKIIESQGYDYVSFSDDIFTLERQRVLELCTEMGKQGITIKWGCATRADCVDYELFKIMKKTGCLDIRFGVESGNERIRSEIIHKRISNEEYEKAVNWARKAGLTTVGFFLFGHPTETLENMEETSEFAKQLKLDYAYFGITVPIPNSETFSWALKEKQVTEYSWKYVISGEEEMPFYCPKNVELHDMRKLLTKANRSFYLRPRYILYQIIGIRSPSEFMFKAKWGLNFIFNRGMD